MPSHPAGMEGTMAVTRLGEALSPQVTAVLPAVSCLPRLVRPSGRAGGLPPARASSAGECSGRRLPAWIGVWTTVRPVQREW